MRSVSGSQGIAPLVSALLSHLRSTDRTALIRVGNTPNVVAEFDVPPADFISEIEKVPTSGHTALWDSILTAVEMTSAEPYRGIVVVFSDGEDDVSTRTQEDVVAAARAAGIPIFVVAIGADREGRRELERTAVDSGAGGADEGFFRSSKLNGLEGLFQKASATYGQRYTVHIPLSASGYDTHELALSTTYSCAAGTLRSSTPMPIVKPSAQHKGSTHVDIQ